MERVSLSKRRDPFEVRMRILHALILHGGAASKWRMCCDSHVAYAGNWAINDLIEKELIYPFVAESPSRQSQVAWLSITEKGRKAWKDYSTLKADLE